MSRILMRAPSDPRKKRGAIYTVSHDRYASNTGNYLFLSSVLRTLMTEDTRIDTVATMNFRFTSADAKIINKKYDAFVIPLANAFRRSFIKELENLTGLIKMLEIPCIVIGVGLQNDLKDNLAKRSVSFDEQVKAFVAAVLEKSSILGVRGRMTADYLTKLGFTEERDFTVIGCPSMYMFGEQLPKVNKRELNESSIISFNTKRTLTKKFHTKLGKLIKQAPNYRIVLQNTESLAGLLTHTPPNGKAPDYFPTVNKQTEKNALAFTDIGEWFSFLKGCTLSVGNRIHGNIAAVLSGTPCYIIVNDARVAELAQYHNLPHVYVNDLDATLSLREIYEQTDFNSVHDGHSARFKHYLHFLEKNGLRHIFSENGSPENTPFDRMTAAKKRTKPVTANLPFSRLRFKTGRRMYRLRRYWQYVFCINPDMLKLSWSPLLWFRRFYIETRRRLKDVADRRNK